MKVDYPDVSIVYKQVLPHEILCEPVYKKVH